ncbi:methylated-DNA--[protein]-cysteine S-methyltransferase [Demequina sp. NBRC 110053]|uniref:methylated-DNA--[protein]-cysteine S-methyltransferase n=1 Tax=Demequina sp. NBRC 110053 TaxID=1570342 RepID=UPI000A00E5DD|nr:methylated-DNA--[protein]-cysteine S-methyltransferase [Demequina sp. NBRC 110053]
MSSTLVSADFATTFGSLHVVASADGTVHAAELRPGSAACTEPGRLPRIAEALAAWEDGDADALTRVPVRLTGSPFFTEVWDTLRTVPAGEVVSYAELAEMAGRPRAMRAAGTACAQNTLSLFVPCHRVIAARGRLGGYGFGGSGIKAALLEHEGVAIAPGPVTADSLVGADAAVTWAATSPRPVRQSAGEW